MFPTNSGHEINFIQSRQDFPQTEMSFCKFSYIYTISKDRFDFNICELFYEIWPNFKNVVFESNKTKNIGYDYNYL